jgi:hypothetical protein
MKHILAQLHKIASYLEDNNYLEDSKEVNKVFVKLSEFTSNPRDPYQTATRHETSRLSDKKTPRADVNDLTTYTKLDIKIRNAPAYSYYQDKYVSARDAYKKQLDKFSMPEYVSTPSESNKLNYLKAEWIASEEDFENWFLKSLIRVKQGLRPTGIPKPVTQSVQTKPIVTKKPTVKQVEKPVPATKPNAVIKDNPVSPAETDTNKTTRKPIMELTMNDRFQPFIDRYNELKAKVGKNKAYNEMQATVYNEDKTPSKAIYRKWENFINLQ